MAFVFTNVAQSAYLADPVTGVARGFFTMMDQITVDFDGSMTPVNGGSGALPILNITKDRNPQVAINGPEFPLHLVSKILGATSTKAASGSPVTVPWSEQRTIGTDGKLNKPLSRAISATNQNVSVITDLDYQTFTAAATTATTGQFVTPVAGDTQLNFNTSDAGKVINIAYNFDSTTGGKIGYNTYSTPLVHRFVASGSCVNTADPNKTPFPAALEIAQCQFDSKWQVDEQRNKVSQSKMTLSILDPGGAQDAITIYPTSDFM